MFSSYLFRKKPAVVFRELRRPERSVRQSGNMPRHVDSLPGDSPTARTLPATSAPYSMPSGKP